MSRASRKSHSYGGALSVASRFHEGRWRAVFEENGCELDTLRADRAICEAVFWQTGDVQSPAERTGALPRGHRAAVLDTIPCGDLSLVVRGSACRHVWADDGNAPQAGQSPTSPSCAISLQPILAKQREPLRDWFGYLLLAGVAASRV